MIYGLRQIKANYWKSSFYYLLHLVQVSFYHFMNNKILFAFNKKHVMSAKLPKTGAGHNCTTKFEL